MTTSFDEGRPIVRMVQWSIFDPNHVRPDPQTREQTRDNLVQFFSNAFGQSQAARESAPK
jgi:hypothetical protein